uniref:BTB domain-containing protein n=1 Tax=Panagrolaimus sp. ES5 TaxID=591445 RepID=A0AC34FBN0_9BILA
MKEKVEAKVEITDFNAKIVELAVEYFYDRKIFKPLKVDELVDLLQFSEKYDIQDLKSEVEHHLIIKVRPKNIYQISNPSINANSQKLKDVCIQSMNFYQNQKIPFDERTKLNEEFVAELNLNADSLFVVD